MDLPPINQQPRSALSTATASITLDGLEKSLVGAKIEANVQTSVLLSDTKQQALVEKLLAEINSGRSQLPANAIEKLKLLAESPRLYLITATHAAVSKGALSTTTNASQLSQQDLTAIDKNLPTILKLLSRHSLPIKALLQAKIVSGGQLELLAVKTPAAIKNPQNLLADLKPAITNEPLATLTKQNQTILAEGLRQYLPHKQTAGNADKLFLALSTAISKLPTEIRKQITDTKTLPLIKQYLPQPPTAKATQGLNPRTSANDIKNATFNSGYFLESKFKGPQTSNQLDADKNSNTNRTTSTGSTQQATTTPPVNVDRKAALLEILSLAASTTNSQTQTPQSNIQQQLATAARNLRGFDNLLTTLNLLAQKTATKEINISEVKNQVARTIAAAAALGIARISAHQLQQLLSLGTDSQQLSQHLSQQLQLEFSLRMQDQVIPVNLLISEDKQRVDEDESENKSSTDKQNKSSLWQIFIELELDNYGKFSAEVSISGQQVKTRLWVEHELLKARVAARLTALKQRFIKDGLEVSELSIEPGQPPNRTQQIQHSLVDVRT